jgi:hypothetical protein
MRRIIVLLVVALLMMLLTVPAALAEPNSVEPILDQGGSQEGEVNYGNCQSGLVQEIPGGESPGLIGALASFHNPSFGGPNNPSGAALCPAS